MGNATKTFLIAAVSVGIYSGATSQAAVQILLDGEGNSGITATDKLIADGAQNPTFLQGTVNGVTVDNTAANAAFGSSSFKFLNTDDSTMNRLELPNTTNLGSSFTLAAMIKGELNEPMELFSSYYGGGAIGNDILFRVNQGVSPDYSRLIFGVGPNVYIQTSTWGSVTGSAYHHVAVTFDTGVINFYRDGVNIETYDMSAQITSFTNGDRNIFIGNHSFAGTQQLAGSVDDILIYDRALTGAEINNIRLNGAATLVPEPSVLGVLALAGGALVGRRRK